MKILALTAEAARAAAAGRRPETDARTGVFTSGIVATGDGHRIALFFTGRQHAGENLADVLAQRAAELAPPIQMCDALSRNTAGDFETILANCLAHARRHFVDVVDALPRRVSGTCSRPCARSTGTTPSRASARCRPRSACASTRPRAAR